MDREVPKRSSSKNSDILPTNPCYFHVEYTPDGVDHRLQTDLVVFSRVLAKVYPAGMTPKIVVPWQHGDTLWVSWTEHFLLDCTDDKIRDIWHACSKSAIHVRIWDSRDKCAVQTRFDRPKSKVLHSSSHPRTIQNLIQRLVSHCGASADNISNKREYEMDSSPSMDAGFSQSNKTIVSTVLKKSSMKKYPSTTRSKTSRTRFSLNSKPQPQKSNNTSRSQRKWGRSASSVKRPAQTDPTVENFGASCLLLNMAHFFRYQPPAMLATRKPTQLTPSPVRIPLSQSVLLQEDTQFVDFVVGLELSEPLLSVEQRRLFKPMVIQTLGLCGLPRQPYESYTAMHEKCEPVQLQWHLGPLTRHTSQCYKQGPDIPMNEIQVILTGLHDNDRIRELLFGTPLTIDLYDRTVRTPPNKELYIPVNTKTQEKKNLAPDQQQDQTEAPIPNALFGMEPGDQRLGLMQPTLETLSRLGDGDVNPEAFTVDRHPHGRACIYLEELLVLRQNRLEADFPVLPLSETNLDLTTQLRTRSENPREMSRDYVGYLESDCALKVRVEFNFEFETPVDPSDSSMGLDQSTNKPEETIERFIIMHQQRVSPDGFNSENTGEGVIRNSSLTELLQFVIQTNAKALQLPTDVSHEDLKVRIKRRKSSLKRGSSTSSSRHGTPTPTDPLPDYQSLITGFYLTDPNSEMIILETSDLNVRKELSLHLSALNASEGIKIMHNSALKFTERLYFNLDWELNEIRLLVPLEGLTGQSLFHVRDLLPRMAYCAVNRVQALRTVCHSLKEATHADILPTSDMLNALAKEFAVPIILTNSISCASTTPRARDSLSSDRRQFPAEKGIMKLGSMRDLSQKLPLSPRRPWTSALGRYRLQETGITTRRSRTTLYRSLTAENKGDAYNYSGQLLNSACMARQELIDTLFRNPINYTYSQRFLHSASFERNNEPLNFVQILRNADWNGGVDSGKGRMKMGTRWDFAGPLAPLSAGRVGFKARLAKLYGMTEL